MCPPSHVYRTDKINLEDTSEPNEFFAWEKLLLSKSISRTMKEIMTALFSRNKLAFRWPWIHLTLQTHLDVDEARAALAKEVAGAGVKPYSYIG